MTQVISLASAELLSQRTSARQNNKPAPKNPVRFSCIDNTVLDLLLKEYPYLSRDVGAAFRHRSAGSAALIWRCEHAFERGESAHGLETLISERKRWW